MSFTEIIINTFTGIISSGGYFAVMMLMVAESMILPIPSEAITPFAGFLVSTKEFTFTGALFFSTLGSLIGSLASYYIGKYGGNPLVKRFGRYVFLNEEHLLKTEEFFIHHGKKTVFFGRLIPVVRHFISIPAGIARMKLAPFIFYTTLGAGIWNAFLIAVGMVLGSNWTTIKQYTHILDIVIVGLIVLAVTWHFIHHLKKKKNTDTNIRI